MVHLCLFHTLSFRVLACRASLELRRQQFDETVHSAQLIEESIRLLTTSLEFVTPTRELRILKNEVIDDDAIGESPKVLVCLLAIIWHFLLLFTCAAIGS